MRNLSIRRWIRIAHAEGHNPASSCILSRSIGGVSMSDDDSTQAEQVLSESGQGLTSLPASANTSHVAGLVNVPHEKKLYCVGPLIALVSVLTAIVAATAIAISASGLSSTQSMMIIAGLLIMGICGLVAAQRKNDKYYKIRIQEMMSRSTALPLRKRLEEILSRRQYLSPRNTLKIAVKQLAEEQHWGLAIRVAPAETLRPLQPVPFAFEPRRIDDLESLSLMDTKDSTVTESRVAAKVLPRGVRRNVLLKGSWFLLGIFLFNWIIALFESIRNGFVQFNLILFSVAILGFAFIPANQSWKSQFIVMPGGLLVRKHKWREKGWRLTLFRRASSCVMMYPLWRQQWILTVSDGENCESVLGLRAELEMTLRAWLSPLEPPPLERLSDFQ